MDKKKNNIDNTNNTNSEFYVPMGRVGSLVIQAPVVLSHLKTSIPITANIDLPNSYNNINTLSNKVFLSKPTLNSNFILSIDGYVEKDIEYEKNCNLSTTIPFKTRVPINFSILPENRSSNNENNNYYKKPPSKISFSIDSIDIEYDSYTTANSYYENSMTISIELTLMQNQYVFIPEPEGDVLLQRSNVIQSTNSQENFYYTVGYDRNLGLIANKTEINSINDTSN